MKILKPSNRNQLIVYQFYQLTILTTIFYISKADPKPLIYPGKVNIGVLTSIHTSNDGSLCNSINSKGIGHYISMASVWSVHMFNQNRFKQLNRSEDIGLYIYDICNDKHLATRQTLKLVSHMNKVGNQMCQNPKNLPPLIGVIAMGKLNILETSLKILSSYEIPTLIINQGPFLREPNVFSMAPNTRQMANAAILLADQLQWDSSSVVISDNKDIFDHDFLKSLNLEGRFSIVKKPIYEHQNHNYRNDNHNYGNDNNVYGNQSHVYYDTTNNPLENVHLVTNETSTTTTTTTNTILFLTASETIDLTSKLFLNKIYHKNEEKDDGSVRANYSWIIITPEDVSEHLDKFFDKEVLKHNSELSRDNCPFSEQNGVFLLSPVKEDTQEFSKFFETIVKLRGIKSDQPLVVEYTKVFGLNNTPKKSISPMAKAVWTLALAYYKITNCTNCPLPDHMNSLMAKQIAGLNETISNSNLKNVDGTQLEFSQFSQGNYLKTWNYQLKFINKNCEIVSLGHFNDSTGWRLDHEFIKNWKNEKGELFIDRKMESAETRFIETPTLRPNIFNESVFGSRINGTSGSSANGSIVNWSRVNQTEVNGSTAKPQIKLIPSNKPVIQLASSLMPTTFKQDIYTYHIDNAKDKDRDKDKDKDKENEIDSQKFTTRSQRQNFKTKKSLEREKELTLKPHNLIRLSTKLNKTTSTLNSTSIPDVTKRKQVSITAWLGNSWSIVIMSLCITGILATLYVQTFLLMKSCEGALKKSNQGLSVGHLLAIMMTFLGSSFYVFYPTAFMCSVRTTIHNIALALLFGSLLLRAMHIRAQKSIGLGGRTSKMNLFLTLLFVVGIQVALEIQQWRFESPLNQETSYKILKLCSSEANYYLTSQSYLSLILILLLIISWSARNTPFNQREGNQVFIVTVIILPVYTLTLFLYNTIDSARYRDILISFSMIIQSFVALIGLFIPLLITIHKYGVFMPGKASSYADSLSTIFTNFGMSLDTDNFSLSSRRSREGVMKGKGANGQNFFTRISPNHFTNPYRFPHHLHHNIHHINLHPNNHIKSFHAVNSYPTTPNSDSTKSRGQNQTNSKIMIPNPLYEGVPGFRSAYP